MPAKNTPTKKTAGPAEKTAAKAAKTPARKSVKKTAQAPQEAALVPEKDLRAMLVGKLLHNFSVQPEEATDENFYNALALVLRDMMRGRRVEYMAKTREQGSKQVYYLCMEFLMGRSLKTPCIT